MTFLLTLRKYLLCFLLLTSAFVAKATHYYVDSSATAGANTGVSWANAYRNLQTGIDNTPVGDTLWVADGHYYPGASGDNLTWFDPKPGVVMLGGFQGLSGAQETSASQRNFFQNRTILSGDLDKNGAHSAADAYHVVNSAGKDTTAIVDGFTIEWGNAIGPGGHSLGAGIFSFGGGGSYYNCVIQNNISADRGAGLHAIGNFIMKRCIFRNNVSASVGGAISQSNGSVRIRIHNSVFINNSANQAGAIYGESNDFQLFNCTFLGNTANFATCLLTTTSNLLVRNCIMWGNNGTAISGTAPNLSRCIIEGGYAPGANVLNVNPEFADAEGRIRACSPAVDAGDTIVTILVDYDGLPRPYDGDGNGTAKWDLGAFEAQSPRAFPLANAIVGPNPACANSYNNLYRVTTDFTPTNTYLWTLASGGTITSTAANDSIRVHWGTTLGAYTISVKETNVASGCATTNTAVISLNAPPTVTLNPSGPDSICNKDSVLVTATGSGISTQWYRNGTAISGATGATIRAKQNGYFNAIMTGANGCSDSAAVGLRLYLRPLPTVTFTTSIPTPICQGSSITITGSPGVTHQWFRNGAQISGATANAYTTSAAGLYNMRQTDSHGCRDSAAVGVNVAINPLPIVTVSPAIRDTICIGDSIALTATTPNAVSRQWFRNQVAIPASNVNPYQAKITGVYNCRVTNTNGCTDSAAVGNKLTVNDFVNPIAVCRNVTTQLNGAGNATVSTAAVNNGSSDNCRIASFALSSSSFTCAQLGNNAVTLTVTDPAGRTATCAATITVRDTIRPIANCSAQTVYLASNGTYNLLPATVGGASTDNCAITLATVTPNSFVCADTGAHAVVYTAQDASGNVRSCSTTIMLRDSTRPNAVCRTASIFLNGAGNASITAASVNNGSSDNCGIASTTVSRTNFNCADVPGVFVTLTLRDVSNNVQSCQAYVRVIDSVAPVPHCRDTTIYIDFSGFSALNAGLLNNNSTDNCVVDSIWISQSTFTCANTGANNVSLFVADADTNTRSCISVVTIVDTIPPQAVCTDTTFYLNVAGIATVNPAVFGIHSIDNCTFFDTSYVNVGTYNCAQTGVHPVKLFVVDVAGRIDSCSGNVTILDNMPPQAHCNNLAPILSPGGTVSIAIGQVNNASTDNCGIQSMSLSQTAFTCANVGPNNIILSVTDVYGNVGTCTSVVTVTDTVQPVAQCRNVTTYLNGAGNATVTTAQVNNGSSDNCGTVNLALSQSSFNCAQTGSNVVALTVSDSYGNARTCTATVTVIDSIHPIAACRNGIGYLAANGQFILPASLIDNGGSDNCGIATRTLSTTNFTCANIGNNTVTLTFTDPSGLARTCSASVTIADTLDPIPNCTNGTFYLNAAGNITLTVPDLASGSTDNCSISSTSLSQSAFTCAQLGANFVTVNFADPSGNTSSCTATVTIADTVQPNAVCQNTQLYLDGAGNAALTVGAINNGSTDACGINSMSISTTAFNCTQVGANAVTLSVHDGSGNIGTCLATVTVLDTIAPAIVCTTATVYLTANGTYLLQGNLLSVGSGDVCTIDTAFASPSQFNCGDIGLQTVQVYVADPSGNLDSCTTTFTLLDNLSPLAICDSVALQLTGNGTATLTPSLLAPSSSDNCGIDSSTVSRSNFSCADVGWIAVTLTLWDSSGNQSSCVGHVMVTDSNGTAIPALNLGPDTTACNGDTLHFAANGGMSDYLWSTGDTTQNIAVTVAGTYWVQVVSAQGCQARDSVVVNSFVSPVPHLRPIGGNPVVCLNDTLRLTVDPVFADYQWSTGDSTYFSDVTTGGNFSVLLTDNNGCKLLQTIAIQFAPFPGPNPIISPSGIVGLCENTTRQLDGGSGYYTYLWNTNQTSQQITIFVPGIYHVTVWNGFGCSATSPDVTVSLLPAAFPDINRSNDTLYTNTVGIGYQWYIGSIPILGATGRMYKATLTGSYTVRAYYADGCNQLSAPLQFIVGVEDELAVLDGIELYPNPSNGQFQLRTDKAIRKAIEIRVTDVYGRVIYQENRPHLHQTLSIDLPPIAAGLYLLELKTAGASSVRRIVIE